MILNFIQKEFKILIHFQNINKKIQFITIKKISDIEIMNEKLLNDIYDFE